MTEKSTLFRASKLSEEEIQSARKLKERFDELKQRTGMTKAAFSREYKFPGGASMISQHISGHRPISLDAAVVYMKGFKCGVADISPTLAAQLPQSGVIAPDSASNQPLYPVDTAQAATNNIATMRPILVWEHLDDLPAGDYVLIPRLDVHLSAGNGCEQVALDLVKDTPQAFRADWIRELRIKPAKLASMKAKGDSMEPRIFDGDAVVVDTGDTTVVDGKVYAVWYDGGERIKRLYRLPGHGLRIASDNASRYPGIDLSENQSQHVRVLGRVRHVASTQGL